LRGINCWFYAFSPCAIVVNINIAVLNDQIVIASNDDAVNDIPTDNYRAAAFMRRQKFSS
jgi:hypothetical protein